MGAIAGAAAGSVDLSRTAPRLVGRRLQTEAVIAAYRAYGYRLGSVSGSSERPTLHLIKRAQHGYHRKIRATGRTSQPPGDFGTW